MTGESAVQHAPVPPRQAEVPGVRVVVILGLLNMNERMLLQGDDEVDLQTDNSISRVKNQRV